MKPWLAGRNHFWRQKIISVRRPDSSETVFTFRQACLRLVFSISALGFLAACVWYVVSHTQDFYFVLTVSRPELMLAALFALAGFSATCYQLDLFLRRFNLKLGKMELVAITHAMMLGNFVIPMRGGSGGLAVYLKKVHKLDYTSFAVIYGGTALLVALINSLLALLALISLWFMTGYFNLVLSTIAISLFTSCLVLTFFPPKAGSGAGWLRVRLVQIVDSWRTISSDRSLLANLTLSLTVLSLTLVLSLFFIYRSLGYPLTLEATIVTSSIGSIVSLVPLTPGSIGVFDIAIIEIQRIFGLTIAQSIAATIIFRTLTFSLTVLIGLPGLIYMYAKTATSCGRE